MAVGRYFVVIVAVAPIQSIGPFSKTFLDSAISCAGGPLRSPQQALCHAFDAASMSAGEHMALDAEGDVLMGTAPVSGGPEMPP